MNRLLYILLLFNCVQFKAQYLLSSNTTLESCNAIDSCVSANNSSFLYYDESKNEFFLKVDFSNFRNADTLDNWLNNERDTCLYVRMIFSKEKFPVLASEERRSFKVNGRIYFNKRWKDQPIEITMYASQNTMMNNTSSSTNYTNNGFENYAVNFTVPFVPTDFKQYAQLYYNSQVVNINVTLGRINMLKPGMEVLVNEVYYLPNH